jgi:hypothetical protein
MQSKHKLMNENKASTPFSLLTLPFRLLIKGYQVFISPMLGQNCRFHPTCSCYAHQALERHGLVKGTWLSIKRIMKCNPMHPGGFDYVPGTDEDKGRHSQTVKNATPSSLATPKNKL